MTPEKWQEVKVVLAEAMEANPEHRRKLLEDRCNGDRELQQEVESLLEYAGEATLETTGTVAPQPSANPTYERVGRVIGSYTLEKLLGEGGMGSVYLAVREVDGYPMRVAFKIMRVTALSEYSLRRFRMERQILARLAHPNITRLLDGGVTAEGLPYLVTEYIEGTPIDEYCRNAELSIVQKLKVILNVCSGLSFAHRNLIVHGDIKPANILVAADGTAKLVDFGIARLLDTDAANLATTTYALTPGWASPEQLRGQPPTVLADLYSLGRVFYEVIAGQPAYRLQSASPAEYIDILSRTPPAPSAVSANSTLRGDLDDIAIKAVECEPEQRYQSADQFANDIEAYLDFRPILARKTTWKYRAAKFTRRHRRGVLAASVIAVMLLSLVASTIWQARAAREQYDISARQAAAVRKLANSFIFDLDDAVAEMPGATQIRANIMTSAVGYLDRLAKESSTDPELQQELGLAYLKVGDIMGRPGSSNLGRTAAALESYRKAQRILEPLARRNHAPVDARLNLAVLYGRISGVLKVKGDFRDALDLDLRALDIREVLLKDSPGDQELRRAVAQSLTSLGGTYSQMGVWSRVLETRRSALNLYEQLVAADTKNLTDRRGLVLARTRLASILSHEGQHTAALDQLRRAVNEQKILFDENPANSQITMAYAGAISAFARGLDHSGDSAGAIREYEQAQKMYERLVVTDSADVRARSLLATTRVSIGRILVKSQRAAAALTHLEPALQVRLELSQLDPMNTGALGEVAESHGSLGDAYLALGRTHPAKQSYLKAHEILTKMQRDGKANAADQSLLTRVESGLARLR